MIDNCKASYGGGLYFGDEHEGICISNSIIKSCHGIDGAGIYISQFNSDIELSGSSFVLNTASNIGGGMLSLANDMSLSACIFENNTSESAPAVYASLGDVYMFNSLVRNNYARGSVGGVYFGDVSSAYVEGTAFVHNWAVGSGGGFTVYTCKRVTIRNCTFEDNVSLQENGGGLVLLNSVAAIWNSSFSGNWAMVDGGTIYLDEAKGSSVSSSVFDNNGVRKGGGSAIWISASENLTITLNVFSSNYAPLGGGTVYWKYSSGMTEPYRLMESNQFGDNNTALYGSHVATDPVYITAPNSSEFIITDYTSPMPAIELSLQDYYRQVVLTESTAVVIAVILKSTTCYESTAYVTGGSVVPMQDGISNFTTLFAYCDPGYSMPLSFVFYSDTNILKTSVDIYFRDCKRGEYFGDSICTQCEYGWYSLTDPDSTALSDLSRDEVCKPCPSGAKRCIGDTIELKEGFWRVSDAATTILSCPFGTASCSGGVGHGDLLCRQGYRGIH